tara:strand:+ start:34 stop:1524 length:1491 start_codon:yes stop_codon:yes gene_type:complete
MSGKYKAVASSAITNGKPVFVHTDGTVKQVSETTTNINESLASEVTWHSSSGAYPRSAVFVPIQNKIVITYEGNNSDLYSIVCNVASDGALTFGTATKVYSASGFPGGTPKGNGNLVSIGSSKIVAVYQRGNQGMAAVGTISGTSISWGSEAEFEDSHSSNGEMNPKATYDEEASRLVISYSDKDSSGYGRIKLGTISGTSISYSSEITYQNSFDVGNGIVAYDPVAKRIIVTYTDNNSYGRMVAGTVSSSSISFGSHVVFESAVTTIGNMSAFDNNVNKLLIPIKAHSSNGAGKIFEVTINTSNNLASTGGAYTFVSPGGNGITSNVLPCVAHFAGTTKSVISYSVFDDGKDFEYRVATVPANISWSFSGATDVEAGGTDAGIVVYDSNIGKFVFFYTDNSDSNKGQARVLQLATTVVSSNLTSENFIGIASGGTYPTAAEATIDIVGTVNKDQTSLTAGQTYYVQTDGTLGTSADDPSVVAGTAISATELIVKG